ncbi:MAG: hypothetical protein FWD87_05100 [Spirochaetaceae bacterium]|nr:hypothetical protein [Spirochaetaceae bacterium]
MLNLDKTTVVDFGKVIFVKKNHSIPALHDMNLIVLKNGDIYQAICIDIEIDAVGNTIQDCCNNLKQTLLCYIADMVHNYNDNITEAIKDIINVAYASGDLKSQLFSKYLEAKHQYLLDKVAKEKKIKSKKDIFMKAWHGIFQFEPIKFDLTRTPAFA